MHRFSTSRGRSGSYVTCVIFATPNTRAHTRDTAYAGPGASTGSAGERGGRVLAATEHTDVPAAAAAYSCRTYGVGTCKVQPPWLNS